MANEIRIVDPCKIEKYDLPLIVLSDDMRGVLSFLIKKHTHGNYNHAMEMVEQGYFASQQFNGYRKVPVCEYLKPYIRIKFFQPVLEPLARNNWIKESIFEMAEYNDTPWYRKFFSHSAYDYLGLAGQFFHVRWINNPWKKYCSEKVAAKLRKYSRISNVPLHPNPAELNSFCEQCNQIKYYGHWFSS